MNIKELPDIGELDSSVWPNILAEQEYGSSYTGAFSTVDGSPVGDITPDRIARIDLTYGEAGDWNETDMVILAELADGTWAACMAWSDTTGFGCRDDVQWKVAPTRDEAISQGLDRLARQKLGVPLPGEESSDD